jgi:hypothetical protein
MKTTAITIHVNEILLDVIDARAALGGMTRERLVFCDTQCANLVASRHLHKAALAKRSNDLITKLK